MEEIDDYFEKDKIDNSWHDVTDVKHSDIRKSTFKVFVNYNKAKVVNLFQAFEENKEIFYHVISHSFLSLDSVYFLLSKKEIKEKFELVI